MLLALAERDTVVRRVITAHATSRRKHHLVGVDQESHQPAGSARRLICCHVQVGRTWLVRFGPVCGYTKKVPDKDNDSDTLCSTYLDPLQNMELLVIVGETASRSIS